MYFICQTIVYWDNSSPSKPCGDGAGDTEDCKASTSREEAAALCPTPPQSLNGAGESLPEGGATQVLGAAAGETGMCIAVIWKQKKSGRFLTGLSDVTACS